MNIALVATDYLSMLQSHSPDSLIGVASVHGLDSPIVVDLKSYNFITVVNSSLKTTASINHLGEYVQKAWGRLPWGDHVSLLTRAIVI